MKIIGDAPTPDTLRHEAKLPPSSKFLGWAVHAAHDDTFLHSAFCNGDTTLRTFCTGPEGAKFFASAAAAGELAIDLTYAAYVVAIFDIDQSYAVISVGGNAASSFGCDANG